MLFDEISMEELGDIRYREGHEDGIERGCEKGALEKAKHVVSLIDQGLSLDEIKQQLTQTANN